MTARVVRYAARVAEARADVQRLADENRRAVLSALADLGPVAAAEQDGPMPVRCHVGAVVRELLAADNRTADLADARRWLDNLYVAGAPIRSADPEIRRLRRAERRAEAAREAS